VTIVNGFTQAPLQSTATAVAATTEQELSWFHTGGVTGSGSFLMAFVGSIDTASGTQMKALSATFSGASEEMMTLAHEVTGNGRSFPSVHVFTLTDPAFVGNFPTVTGLITVTMSEPATNINALSVVMSGVDTTALGYLPGSFAPQSEIYLTSTGALSGTVSSTAGDLLIDCVVAAAGIPDDHTLGPDQILDGRLAINTGGSAKVSVSHKFATTAEHGKSMSRTDVTTLERVSGIKFAVGMH
jgi:hypothetical protein